MLSLFLHMRKILAFNINSVEDFRRKCIEFARQFDTFILLDSHSDKLEKVSKYAEFDMIAAAGHFRFASGLVNDLDMDVKPMWPLTSETYEETEVDAI